MTAYRALSSVLLHIRLLDMKRKISFKHMLQWAQSRTLLKEQNTNILRLGHRWKMRILSLKYIFLLLYKSALYWGDSGIIQGWYGFTGTRISGNPWHPKSAKLAQHVYSKSLIHRNMKLFLLCLLLSMLVLIFIVATLY